MIFERKCCAIISVVTFLHQCARQSRSSLCPEQHSSPGAVFHVNHLFHSAALRSTHAYICSALTHSAAPGTFGTRKGIAGITGTRGFSPTGFSAISSLPFASRGRPSCLWTSTSLDGTSRSGTQTGAPTMASPCAFYSGSALNLKKSLPLGFQAYSRRHS